MTDEERRRHDKSTLKNEIKWILAVIGLSVLVMFVSKHLCRLGMIDDGIVFILFVFLPIFIIGCLLTMARLLWRLKKL